MTGSDQGRSGDDEPPKPTTVELVDTNLHATDRMDNEVTVETTGWDGAEPRHEFPSEMDIVVGGRVSELSVQAAFSKLSEVGADGQLTNYHKFDMSEALELDEGDYHVNVETPISTSVRFEGPATISITEDDRVVVSFPQPVVVTVGFTSWLRYPKQTITVPRTPDGIATALSHFSASIQTMESPRSSDGSRHHPPMLEFDDTEDIPDGVRDHVPETGLELRLPERMDVLFQAAPIAYYLGATVVLHDDAPELVATDNDLAVEFSAPPRFQYEVASLLRRTFNIDSLVRNDQSENPDTSELDVLDEIAVDTDTYDDLTAVERLQVVLDVDFDAVDDDVFPEWHSVHYVEPTFENARVLPYVLRYLNVVFDPSAYPTPEDGPGELDREFSDTLPDRLFEDTAHGSAIGWLSSTPPPNGRAFLAHPDGYENARRYVDRDDGAGRLLVVCNDTDRSDTARTAADGYRTYTPDSMTIETHEETTRAELADLLETGGDFLHFVGPVDGGFHCTDGTLELDDVDETNVRLFFADAPDSVATATTWLRHGSVGGFGIDGDEPLEERTRIALVGLFSRGLTVDKAARYANAYFRTTPNARVVAVGDAFHQLVRSVTLYCVPTDLEPVAPNAFHVTAYPYIPEAGFVWRPNQDSRSQLCAKPYEFTVTGPELEMFIDKENLIVVHDDDLHWDPTLDFFNPLV